MTYIKTRCADELWCIRDIATKKVLWSRGGSSSSPRLMVFDSRKSAERALNNSWTKQIIPDQSMVEIKQIY